MPSSTPSPTQDQLWLHADPDDDGTDGFFVACFERAAPDSSILAEAGSQGLDGKKKNKKAKSKKSRQQQGGEPT